MEVYIHGVSPGDQYKVRGDVSDPPFARIHEMFTKDISCPEVNTSPETCEAI